jgi:hypothetical protein
MYYEALSAATPRSVTLPNVSGLPATADKAYRLVDVPMLYEEQEWLGPDGKLLCLVCDPR